MASLSFIVTFIVQIDCPDWPKLVKALLFAINFSILSLLLARVLGESFFLLNIILKTEDTFLSDTKVENKTIAKLQFLSFLAMLLVNSKPFPSTEVSTSEMLLRSDIFIFL